VVIIYHIYKYSGHLSQREDMVVIMKKRTAVRILSYSLAAVAVSVGLLCVTLNSNRLFRLEIENSYSKSLEEFGMGMNNISITLQKAQYVSTPDKISELAARLLTEAQLTKNALSQLPHSGQLSKVNEFLSQVGNYAMSVSKQLILSGEMDEKDKLNITELSKTAEKLADIVGETNITFNNQNYWASELSGEIEKAVDTETLSSALDGAEEELDDYPTLIYDGPYSDHLLEKEPLMLKNAEEVTEDEAKAVAARFAEADGSSLKKESNVYGKMQAYRFIGQGVTVSVSKKGGYGIYMRKERAVNETILSYNQAVEKAKRYLKAVGLQGFKETYYFTDEGVCVVNFAFVDGKTICYTDLVKVGVAMDNGEIMLYEGSGYLANHTDRTFTTPKYTVDEARALLSDSLQVQSSSLALIPTNSREEVRCYEFSCIAPDGREILVYINASTLNEEEILILLKSDGGTLVK